LKKIIRKLKVDYPLCVLARSCGSLRVAAGTVDFSMFVFSRLAFYTLGSSRQRLLQVIWSSVDSRKGVKKCWH